jgi:hypothetical protein
MRYQVVGANVDTWLINGKGKLPDALAEEPDYLKEASQEADEDIPAPSAQSCSGWKVSHFSACLLNSTSGDESTNPRFTKQWRSVPFRSTGFGTDLFSGIHAHFASSSVPLRSVPSACFAGGFAGRPERRDHSASFSARAATDTARRDDIAAYQLRVIARQEAL